jgi:hypothetical protein
MSDAHQHLPKNMEDQLEGRTQSCRDALQCSMMSSDFVLNFLLVFRLALDLDLFLLFHLGGDRLLRAAALLGSCIAIVISRHLTLARSSFLGRSISGRASRNCLAVLDCVNLGLERLLDLEHLLRATAGIAAGGCWCTLIMCQY